MGIKITDEQINSAYPRFYGELVRVEEFAPKDENSKSRVKIAVKPYNLEVKNPTGVLTETYFYGPDDLAKSYTDIHRFIMGLKNRGVPEGDTDQAVNLHFCAWWQKEPPKGDFQGKLHMTNAKKGETVPPAPDDWDRDAWLEENPIQGENGSGDAPAPGSSQVSEADLGVIVAAVSGVSQSKAVVSCLKNPDLASSYDTGTIGRAIESLFKSGRLVLADGKYQAA